MRTENDDLQSLQSDQNPSDQNVDCDKEIVDRCVDRDKKDFDRQNGIDTQERVKSERYILYRDIS